MGEKDDRKQADPAEAREQGAIPRSEDELSPEEREKKERAREEFNLHEADYRRNPQG